MGLLSIRWNRISAANRPHSGAHRAIVETPGKLAEAAAVRASRQSLFDGRHRFSRSLFSFSYTSVARFAIRKYYASRLAIRARDRLLQRRRRFRSAAFTRGRIRRVIEVVR